MEQLREIDFESIKIGKQEWMLKNLDVDRFRNGDLIPHIRDKEEWVKAGNNKQPAWCYYDNNPENGKIYGKLYNWYAVNDKRGLAPAGWHVPSDAEWTVLTTYLGGESVAGSKMKSVRGWNDWEDKYGEIQNGNGDNSSGFNALPGSTRHFNGRFEFIRYTAFFWSATYNDFNHAFIRFLHYNLGYVNRSYDNSQNGFSVRCLRD